MPFVVVLTDRVNFKQKRSNVVYHRSFYGITFFIFLSHDSGLPDARARR